MKIALIGFGAMGKLVRCLAEEKGHVISAVIDEADAFMSAEDMADKLAGADVAIDFTVAAAVRRNVEACVLAGVPVVEGTTGWDSERAEIEKIVTEGGGAIVYGANFSIGVNLFYHLVDLAAKLAAGVDGYEPFIEERHHSRKKDAPSGTALKLKAIVADSFDTEFTVTSTRAGNIPGTHTVGFDGPADQIRLTHTARSREGFAAGALFAAERIIGKKGFYEFSSIFKDLTSRI